MSNQSSINTLINEVETRLKQYRKNYDGLSWREKVLLLVKVSGSIKKLGKNSEPDLSNHNAHIYYSLLDARQCASKYLEHIQKKLTEKSNTHLSKAAKYYTQIAKILEKGMVNIVWDWQYSKGITWSKEKREAQADILRQASTLERRAVDEIKNYLAK